jgi:uncharacterized protein (TIGR03437 family)
MGSVRIGVLLLGLSRIWAADSALTFTKTFGGSGNESIGVLAADRFGNIVAAGSTSSYDFPVTNGTFNTATHFAGSADSGGLWYPLSNLPSGTPISLAVDTSTPPVWYAGGLSDVFKSTDGGATWQSIGPRGLPKCDYVPPFCGVLNVVVNPAQPTTLYARSASAGILKTTDGGATWSSTNAPANPNPPAYLALDPFHPDHLFTNIGNNDFRSFDGGQTWTQFTPPLLHPGNYCGSPGPPVAFDTVTPGVVYIVDHCDLFRSTDGGVFWDPVAAPFSISYAVIAHPARTGAIYVTTFTGLYGSSDGGATWSLLLPNEQGNPPHIVAIDPQQPSIIMTEAFRTQDGGVTWTPLALGRSPSAIVFDPQAPGRAIAATGGASTAFLTKLDAHGAIWASTYFGGQGTTSIAAAVVDADGFTYVTGTTNSPDFPAEPVAGATSFVAKFDWNLTLVYARFLDPRRQAAGIAVDGNGSIVVTGTVPPIPSAPSACFVTKLTADGKRAVFSTLFGGTGGDLCSFAAADAAGNTILSGTTWSRDFPVTGGSLGGSLQGYNDAFLAKFDPSGKLILSGYLGGSDRESAAGVAVDTSGNIYVVGATASKDFPTTPGAYQTALSSHCPYPSASVNTGLIGTIRYFETDDVFVTKLDPAGNAIFSTYLGGGCYDTARGMALDPSGNVWILGSTDSDPFPQLSPFQSGPPYAYYKAFVTELDAGGGSLRLSSYIEEGGAIAVDASGFAWIGGSNALPGSPYGGLPAPPLVVTGVHAWLAQVQPQAPGAVAIQSVGNAFSRRSGPVSPGQITLISASGIAPAQPLDLGLSPSAPLPPALAGTQVLFDGEAAPLISVAAGQVVAIAPYGLAGKTQTAVQVVFQGTASAPVLADVLPDTGYRSLDGSGTGQAYAINPDGTLNSPQNPAPIGSSVTVETTGVGVVDPACPAGGVAAVATPVPNSGLTGLSSVAGSVCGLFQATVRTPGYSTSFALPNSALMVSVK